MNKTAMLLILELVQDLEFTFDKESKLLKIKHFIEETGLEKEFKWLLKTTYDPHIHLQFSGRDLIQYFDMNLESSKELSFNSLKEFLTKIIEKEINYDDALAHITYILTFQNPKYLAFFLSIFDRDLKIGLTHNDILKLYPDLFQLFEVQKISSKVEVDKYNHFPLLLKKLDLKDQQQEMLYWYKRNLFDGKGRIVNGLEQIKEELMILTSNEEDKLVELFITMNKKTKFSFHNNLKKNKRTRKYKKLETKAVIIDMINSKKDLTPAFERFNNLKATFNLRQQQLLDTFKFLSICSSNFVYDNSELKKANENNDYNVLVYTNSTYEFGKTKNVVYLDGLLETDKKEMDKIRSYFK